MQLSNNRQAVKHAVAESLECRRHFIIAFYSLARLSGGVLDIEGTSQSDTIVLSKSGSNLKVVGSSSTKTFTFPIASVNKVEVFLYAGDDKFTSDNSVTRPMNVDGNFGKDTITTGGGDDDIFSGNEDDKVNGGDGKDTIDGGSGNDTLNGNGGNDSLFDGSGSDNVFGGSGDDKFDVGVVTAGSDLYDGGDGAEDRIFYSSRTSGVSITTDGIANDGKKPSSGFNSLEKDNVLPNIEIINATDYADQIKLSGNVNNTIYALGGSDSIDAGPGNDDIDAGRGLTETVYGGTGNDRIITGDGNARIFAGDGNDKVSSGSGSDIIYGGSGNDSLEGYGGNDYLYGESGNDTLAGGSDSDYLYGGSGNDVLNGEDANDILYGGADNDILVGGNGYDRMYGEAGHDQINALDFIFNEIVDGGSGSDFALIDKYPPFNIIPGDQLIGIESW